jgi:16S rRNA (uracil1498-N3)-methyltransferase
MTAPRFFTAADPAPGATIALDNDDAHHAAHVLRLAPGASVVLIHDGRAWDATLTEVAGGRVLVRAVALRDQTGGELPVSVSVLQALTKGRKFDDVVEKCVELGAVRIVPVICARSYAQADAVKVERWRRIALAAAQQSRRLIVPQVDAAVSWRDAIGAAGKPLIVAWEGAAARSFASVVARHTTAPSLSIAVGPEGSFTDDELRSAREAGAGFVSLGPTILRTETAAAALLAAIASNYW